ncbi:hypothetical protein QJS04_geneDACA008389 [Acorus gramineus]|uniref:MADS-box domain-containing protein n=1 Tax=Acorus gramineus TaxID=55184 RepID=A0AAV9AGK0_ACOGR|nr:hypothetical protein QJS04_geneDACA008389 [Acorus gramineus]
MVRQRRSLSYIANDTLRRRTFLKREMSLLKKASELSILCGVPSCVLIAAPCDPNRVITWPSAVHARTLISLTRDIPTSSSARSRRELDQDAFLSREVARLKEQIQRVEKETREAEAMVALMRCIRGEGCADQLDAVGCLAEEKARAVAERIERIKGWSLLGAPVPDELAAAPPPPPEFINQPELGPNGPSA